MALGKGNEGVLGRHLRGETIRAGTHGSPQQQSKLMPLIYIFNPVGFCVLYNILLISSSKSCWYLQQRKVDPYYSRRLLSGAPTLIKAAIVLDEFQ